jgi:hypothetical protein
VSPHGSGGSAKDSTKYEGLWIFGFNFYAWRDADGILHRDNLLVRGEMTRDRLRNHMLRTAAYSIVKVRIAMRENDSAEFLELLDDKVNSDEELTEIAVELQKPVIYEHERFGTFVFNRPTYHWETTVDWLGKPVRLMMHGYDASGPDEGALQTAQQLWDNQSDWNTRISDYAVEQLLPSLNEIRTDEYVNELPLSPDEFKSLMTLESIGVSPDGSFHFSHDDGYMFGGHWIVILGDIENGPTDYDMPG